jgi:hypothetical protein
VCVFYQNPYRYPEWLPAVATPGIWRFGLASEKHPVGVDQAGKVIEDFVIEHSALGWKKLGQKLQSHDRSFCHWDQPEIRRYPKLRSISEGEIFPADVI